MSYVQDYTLAVTFRAEREEAERIRAALNTTLAAITAPTEERASALFELGALAVCGVAASKREAPGEP